MLEFESIKYPDPGGVVVTSRIQAPTSSTPGYANSAVQASIEG